MGAAAAAALAVALAALPGCKMKGHAKVEGVLIPQADGNFSAPDGATLAVDVGTLDKAAVPAGAKVVRLAIGRKVPWTSVEALMARVQKTGARPVLLVGDFDKVRGFRLNDEPWPGGPSIRVISYIDGKACVQPPGAIEAKCVQSTGKAHIERAYLRELVREQVKMYDVHQVEVEVARSLGWADVVRTIDGARTCCYETVVKVRLKPPGTPAGPELVPAD